MGPEIMIELIRVTTVLQSDVQIIVQLTEKNGKEERIELTGDYEEWLYYFACYKRDCILLAKEKTEGGEIRVQEKGDIKYFKVTKDYDENEV